MLTTTQLDDYQARRPGAQARSCTGRDARRRALALLCWPSSASLWREAVDAERREHSHNLAATHAALETQCLLQQPSFANI